MTNFLFIYVINFFYKKIKNTIYKYDKHICVWCKYCMNYYKNRIILCEKETRQIK